MEKVKGKTEKQTLKDGRMYTFLMGVETFCHLFLSFFRSMTWSSSKELISRMDNGMAFKLGMRVPETLVSNKLLQIFECPSAAEVMTRSVSKKCRKMTPNFDRP